MCLEEWVRDLLFDKDYWTEEEYDNLIKYFKKLKGPVEGIQTQYIWGKYYLMVELGYLGTDIEVMNERHAGEPKFYTYRDNRYWEVKTLKGKSLKFTIAQTNMPENTTVLIFDESGNFLDSVSIFDLYNSCEYNVTYTYPINRIKSLMLKKAMSKYKCNKCKIEKTFSTKDKDTAKIAYDCIYATSGEQKVIVVEDDETTKFEVIIELPAYMLRLAQQCDLDLNELLYDFIRKLQSDSDFLKLGLSKQKELDFSNDISHIKEEIKVELPSDLSEFVLHSDFDFDEILCYAIEMYIEENSF